MPDRRHHRGLYFFTGSHALPQDRDGILSFSEFAALCDAGRLRQAMFAIAAQLCAECSPAVLAAQVTTRAIFLCERASREEEEAASVLPLCCYCCC